MGEELNMNRFHLRYFLVSLFLLISFPVFSQIKRNSAYQAYFDKYKDIAIEEMLRYNIPASITLAQGVYESRAGMSLLTVNGNNHFGIKCHGWTGRTITADDDEEGECFRAYNNAEESYEDHSKFLVNNKQYSSLFNLSRTDYKGWAAGLKACGYATNPQYSQRIIQIIELYNLNQYDLATKTNGTSGLSVPIPMPSKHSYKSTAQHTVLMCNENYYIRVRKGDTFRSIAKEFGLSYKRLVRFNERDKDDVLTVGEVLYLKRKRSKADKAYQYRRHVVKAGESMYSISQYYGIRLKSLYKKNGLDPMVYQIEVGDSLRVY